MFRAKRLTLVSIAAAALPLLVVGNAMAGGAFEPPQHGFRVTGPAVSASIVMDAHDGVSFPNREWVDPNTSLPVPVPAQASIRLYKGSLRSGAVFTIPAPETFFNKFGCDASLTEARFLATSTNFVTLLTWIPDSILTELFYVLGIPINNGTFIPIITHIDNPVCTTDPTNPGPGTPAPGQLTPPLAGTLSFDATIQFAIPNP